MIQLSAVGCPLTAVRRFQTVFPKARGTADIRLSDASFPPIDIYRQMSHWRRSPRFFASLRMTCSAGKQKRNVDYKTHRRQRRRYHNPRPHRPSVPGTLRTFGDEVPVHLPPLNSLHLLNLFHNPSTQPAADRRPQPAPFGRPRTRPAAGGPFSPFFFITHAL